MERRKKVDISIFALRQKHALREKRFFTEGFEQAFGEKKVFSRRFRNRLSREKSFFTEVFEQAFREKKLFHGRFRNRLP